VSEANLALIEHHLPLLEQCLSFNLAYDLFVESDMHTDERTTGLSEEKLLTENISAKETLVNSLMLMALVRYKRDASSDLEVKRKFLDYVLRKTGQVIAQVDCQAQY